MGQKIISFICSVLILISTFLPTVMLGVIAEELPAGSFPYFSEKDSSTTVRTVEDAEITAYKDFVAKSTLDDLTESNYLNTWRLYNRNNSEYVTNSKVLATASLEKYSDSSDNVYAQSGNAIKISYTNLYNSKISPAKGTENQYFHFIRQNVPFSIPNDYLNSASISFWVKTDYQAYIILRLTCNGYETKDFIVSERILVPAGESVVEIPLSNFITSNNGYTAINNGGSLKVNIADIYFKATESFTGTRDIYFDNLGFYYYASNSKKELHSSGFALKNDLENLVYSFEENRDKVVDGSGITWRDDDKGNLGVTSDTDYVYNGIGSSLYYTTESIFTENSANYNCVTNNAPCSTKIAGENVGKDAVVCIWIKSDRALKAYIRALDSSWTENRYRSGEYFVPAGESILKVPLSDLNIQDSNSINCDFLFKWDSINSLGIYFKSATATAVTGTSATVYIDKFGIEKGKETEPQKPPVPDTVVTHSADFKEIETTADKWINKTEDNAVLSTETEAEHYHSGVTNVGENKSAIKVAYSNLDSATSNIRFYYDKRLTLSDIAPFIYEEDSVLSFWAWSDQSVNVRVTYMDYDSTTQKSVQCDSKVITLPAGESIVKIPMSEMAKNGQALGYRYAYQLQMVVLSNDQSIAKDGTLFIDAIGFYDKDLTNDIPSIPEVVIPDTIVNHSADFKEVETTADKWMNKTESNAVLSVETEAEHYHSGVTNVGENKSAIKVAYSNLDVNASNVRFYYDYRLSLSDIAPFIYEEDSVLSFWAWSDQSVNVRVTYMDYDSTTQKSVQCDSKVITLPAGESIVKIPMSEMAKNGQYLGYRYAYQLQMVVLSNDQSIAKDGTLFIDAIGFYDKDLTNDIPSIPEVIIPDTIVNHSADFKEVTTVADKWMNKTESNAVLSVETEAEHYHSGVTNVGENKSAIKVAYENLDSTASNIRFYYDNRLSINNIAPFIYEEDSVLSFWAWSDQSVNVRITYMDYDATTQKAVQCDSKVITLPAGESIVKIPMSEMAKNGQYLGYRYAYQLQMVVLSNDQSIAKDGTLFIDAIGFYDKDLTNDIPSIPEVIIPDIVAKHEIGFSEVTLDNSLWVNKKTETSTFTLETDSEHYHSGKTNIGVNKDAWKLSYTNLSSTASNVNFYYNSGIKISNSHPYIFGESSVLSFWVYSEQPLDFKINYMDFSIDAGKSIPCKSITVSIPAGESIVKIPMKDLATDGNRMQYRHCYQLQFVVLANSDSSKPESDLWLDAIGFYDSSLVINDKPLEVPENTYIWWNFDKCDTVEKLNGEWTTRFEGEGNKGISLSIESSSENTYGGKGNSLKIVYDRKLGYAGIPCIWHEERMTAYGDGLVFWIKSEEKTNIVLVCVDANYKGVKSKSIPVTIGYNIVSVKWSDFEFLDAKESGKPLMTNVSQLQIRPNGCNNGTLWLDQIGFSNVNDDGSNAYYSLYPPTEYKNWYEGVSVIGDDFEGWPGDDDMKFCSEWYFDETGWISLVKNGNNTMLKMDYDFTKGKKSELTNITRYDNVDPNGGISFWAKSSEERYYTLKVWIGDKTIAVVIKGSTEGRYYKIPFSSFWISNKIGNSFENDEKGALTVQRISLVTDSTCNPPAMNTSEKCSVWLDDIKFVDSASYKRAAKVEHYENGVCLKAPVEAFDTGVTVKIEKSSLEGKEDEYLPKMSEFKKVGSLYKIETIDIRGIAVTPKVEVELIFDIPEGEKAENVIIYQKFLDGSLSKRKSSIEDDGKVHISVYRLGEYLMGFGDGTVDKNTNVEIPKAEKSYAVLWISVGAIILVAVAVIAGIIIFKWRRVKK